MSLLERCCPELPREGSIMRASRLTENFRILSPRGMVVGDILWLLVIAFLFAIITGVVG
jgi:hypothetical protein